MLHFFVSFVLLLPIYASTACVNASIPVSAVICGGSFTVTNGSRTATCGIIEISITGCFSFVSLFEKTAASVASAPVPAVVGTTNNGGNCFRFLKNPYYRLR